MECAQLSPSGGNEQSWKFGVITDKSIIEKIATISYDQKWIASSPLVIALCTITVEETRTPRFIQKSRYPEWESEIANMNKDLYDKLNSEEHQTKIPGTHMVLAALERGIHSTWVSYFKVDELSQLLKLPPNIFPAELLVFGYPEHDIPCSQKKSLEELTFTNEYQ